MADTAIRGGVGDASGFWAALCMNYARTRDEAAQCGLTSRWQFLVDALRRGDARVEDWLEVTAEIAELLDQEENYASRGGDFVVAARIDADIAMAGGFGCPGRLCGRRVVALPPAVTPRCALLRRDMIGVDA